MLSSQRTQRRSPKLPDATPRGHDYPTAIITDDEETSDDVRRSRQDERAKELSSHIRAQASFVPAPKPSEVLRRPREANLKLPGDPHRQRAKVGPAHEKTGQVQDMPVSHRDSSTAWLPGLVMQSFMDALPFEAAIVNGTGNIIAVNRLWRKGRHPALSVALGSNYLDACAKLADTDPGYHNLVRGLQALMSGVRRSWLHVLQPGAEDARSYRLRAQSFAERGQVQIAIFAEDVTAERQLEEERSLLDLRLSEVQDRERRRIARELHDSTAQHILSVGIGLDRLAPFLHDEMARDIVEDMRASLGEVQQEIREASYLLHSPFLGESLLVDVLKQYVAGFTKRTGLKVDTQFPEERIFLSEEQRDVFFRIAQEALVNAHKHANAKQVTVRLARRGAQLRLTIADDGIGIPLCEGAQFPAEPGLGISGMHARAQRIGAKLLIARKRKGTSVSVSLVLAGET